MATAESACSEPGLRSMLTWMVMERLSTLPTPSRMTVSSTGQDQLSAVQLAPCGPPGVPLYSALRKPLYESPCMGGGRSTFPQAHTRGLPCAPARRRLH